MNLEEFELESREQIEQILNRLQTVTVLTAQLDSQLAETGHAVRSLSHLIETFIREQRQQPGDSSRESP